MRPSLWQLLLLTGAAFHLAACSRLPGIVHSMDWQEEVLLHDGQIALAERQYNFGGYPTLDSTQRSVVNEKTSFTLPETGQRITWQSDFRDTVPEPNSLNLLLFDVVNGVPYIATYPAGCIAYNKWQRPNPFYVLFKHKQGGWRRISMAEFPVELSKTNIIVGGPTHKPIKPYYTAESVNSENKYLEPKHSGILRTAMEDPVGRCGEMVSDGKGGWIGIGWFKEQPNLQDCVQFCKQKAVLDEYCPCKRLFNED